MRIVVGLLCAATLTGCVQYEPATSHHFDDRSPENMTLAQRRVYDMNAEIDRIKSAQLPKDYRAKVDNYFFENLKDPDSRKIEFRSHPFPGLVCGTINARNSYGGYTGRQPFIAYYRKDNSLYVESFSDDDVYVVLRNPYPGDPLYIEFTLLNECGLGITSHSDP